MRESSRPGSRRVPLVRTEALPLAVLLVFAGLLLVFGAITDEVVAGEPHAVDRLVLLAFRSSTDPGDPIGPRWVEETARDLTGLGSAAVLTLVWAAVTGFLALTGRRAAAILLTISVGTGALLSVLLKLAIQRPRPDIVPHAVAVHTASFPSGHAMLAAITYLTLGALLARVQPSWRARAYILSVSILVTAIIGFSRIYLGVHWPTDVVAGWCLGAAWALGSWLVVRRLQQRGRIGPD